MILNSYLQKNPHTIRYPEEDNGKESSDFEYTLDLSKSSVISEHIHDLCINATAVYIQVSSFIIALKNCINISLVKQ